MEYKELRRTELFGVPRDASVYVLNAEEVRLIADFEARKARVKENVPVENSIGLKDVTSQTEVSCAFENLNPLICEFLSSLIDGRMNFSRFRGKFNYGRGFKIEVEPVSVIKRQKDELKFLPKFLFNYPENATEMYCWATLERVCLEPDFHLDTLVQVFHRLYLNQDGVNVPKISRGEVIDINPANMMPWFFGKLRFLYKELGEERIEHLSQLEQAMRREVDYGSREVVLEALDEKFMKIAKGTFLLA